MTDRSSAAKKAWATRRSGGGSPIYKTRVNASYRRAFPGASASQLGRALGKMKSIKAKLVSKPR